MTKAILKTDKSIAASINYAIHVILPGENLDSNISTPDVEVQCAGGQTLPTLFAWASETVLVCIVQGSKEVNERKGCEEIVVIVTNPSSAPSDPVTVPVVYTEP